jgi:putative FmdB family regulatory protein
MPLYEYVCCQCGQHLEVVQKVSDPPLRKCRSCGGALKKLISAPAIQFKGNGWYITDYAKKSSPQEDRNPKEKAREKTKEKPQPTEASPAPAAKPESSTSKK